MVRLVYIQIQSDSKRRKEMATISLKGLNKGKVLAALYNASHPQGLGILHFDPDPMTLEQAEFLLKRQTDFDYLKGRVLKVDLSGDEFDPWLYDRDNGEGAAAAAIESCQETDNVNSDAIRKAHSNGTLLSIAVIEPLLDQESSFKNDKNIASLNLGVGEFKEQLLKNIEKIRKNNPDK